MKRTPRRMLLGSLVVAAFAATGSVASHDRLPTPYGITERTLPCVDVTVHITEPPPYAYVCPPF